MSGTPSVGCGSTRTAKSCGPRATLSTTLAADYLWIRVHYSRPRQSSCSCTTFCRSSTPSRERWHNMPNLNCVKLRLGHKDLHLANVLYDTIGNVAGSVPCSIGSSRESCPSRNGTQRAPSSGPDMTVKPPQTRKTIFAERCSRRNVAPFILLEHRSPPQEHI